MTYTTYVDKSQTPALTKPTKAPRQTFQQASFRLPPDTYAAIKEIAVADNISQSTVMRLAANLLKQSRGLAPNIKLAMVDTTDAKGSDYYRVVSWLLSEDAG